MNCSFSFFPFRRFCYIAQVRSHLQTGCHLQCCLSHYFLYWTSAGSHYWRHTFCSFVGPGAHCWDVPLRLIGWHGKWRDIYEYAPGDREPAKAYTWSNRLWASKTKLQLQRNNCFNQPPQRPSSMRIAWGPAPRAEEIDTSNACVLVTVAIDCILNGFWRHYKPSCNVTRTLE